MSIWGWKEGQEGQLRVRAELHCLLSDDDHTTLKSSFHSVVVLGLRGRNKQTLSNPFEESLYLKRKTKEIRNLTTDQGF